MDTDQARCLPHKPTFYELFADSRKLVPEKIYGWIIPAQNLGSLEVINEVHRFVEQCYNTHPPRFRLHTCEVWNLSRLNDERGEAQIFLRIDAIHKKIGGGYFVLTLRVEISCVVMFEGLIIIQRI